MHKCKCKIIQSIILTTSYKRGVEHNFGQISSPCLTQVVHTILFQFGNLNIYVYNNLLKASFKKNNLLKAWN